MNYHVKCLKCGADWWQRGSYESDTNAVCLDDNKLPEGMCECGDQCEIIDEEAIDFEDCYL